MTAGGVSDVAVVTIVRDRRDHLARQREWLARHPDSVRHVIVDMGGEPISAASDTRVVDFQVSPGTPLPLAAARNLGARHADAEILIFLDVDCIPTPGLVPAYERSVRRSGGVRSGPVGYLPPSQEVREWEVDELVRVSRFHDGRPRIEQRSTIAPSPDMFWSLSFALTSTTFSAVGGFDESFDGYGGEDTDFARAVAETGVDLWFDGDAVAFHQHHAISNPPVEHLADIMRNATRFHEKWGAWPMAGWLKAFCDLGLIEWNPTSTEIVRCPPAPRA